MGIGDSIKFLGWVNNKEVPEYIANADVGIVPHHKCSHWDNTIPNKLFDYMAAGKPVIVSNVIPMARIVNETECGKVYSDYDVDSLVSVIEQLENNDLRSLLGKIRSGLDATSAGKTLMATSRWSFVSLAR